MLQVQIGGVTAQFFQSDAIAKKAEKGVKRSLSKCGAYVRTAAKSSLKYGKKASTPGSPPNVLRLGSFTRSTTNKKKGTTTVRAVSPLKELIFFGYDAASESVVVGPMVFKNSKSKYLVASVLEKGGMADGFRKGKKAKVYVAARPTMNPAMRKEAPKFAGLFKGLLQG
jgi:hypothetical protein